MGEAWTASLATFSCKVWWLEKDHRTAAGTTGPRLCFNAYHSDFPTGISPRSPTKPSRLYYYACQSLRQVVDLQSRSAGFSPLDKFYYGSLESITSKVAGTGSYGGATSSSSALHTGLMDVV